MLIDTGVTIAYKCSACGTFEFFDMSLFKFLYKKEYKHTCKCSKSSIVINGEKSGGYKISIPCIGCGNEHIYFLTRRDLLHKDINIFYCPEKGIQQCFIGKDDVVREKIDSFEEELDELIDTFGYDDYFKNTQVMFDTLNRIHDIAEQGNLFCECGNDDIEVMLLPDRIHLKCRKCSGSRMISAASNEDLKDILTKPQVVLLGGYSGYSSYNTKSFMRKTDRK